MAEQNLIAVAAGLARTGIVPFATTYGVFATRRAYDFIAIACAHSGLNVKIIAGLPGLTTGYGGTHQAIEDLGLMRMVPGLTIIDPCDATEIVQATRRSPIIDGPVYMRLLRGNVPVVLDPARYRFEIGKASLLRDGGDVGILIGTGLMTGRALEAATALEGAGHRRRRAARADPEALRRRCGAEPSRRRSITSSPPRTTWSPAASPASSSRRCSTHGVTTPLTPDRRFPTAIIECGSVPFLQVEIRAHERSDRAPRRRACRRARSGRNASS